MADPEGLPHQSQRDQQTATQSDILRSAAATRGEPWPGEVHVPEETIPAHTIRATATPRAVALMVGLISLGHGTVDKPACDVTESGGAIWRLRHGFVVTLEFGEDGSVLWHLDVEQEPRDA